MRIALDTNVIVSALATRGLCADLFQAVLAEHELVVGETVLAELRSVLHRTLRLPDATIDALDAFLRRQAVIVVADATRSPDSATGADAAVLAEAVGGSAEVLVTGDQGLLNMPVTQVRVVSPRQLWDVIRRAR
ncbi:MAG TPA: putative toxin-antitoxin system toxin component, PIN family [bacterium]|nr:putative toxin-antitoxin system toxin component, PIN family [bacterium]